MALIRFFLAAEEACAVEFGRRKFVFDMAGMHQVQKLQLVFGPNTFFLLVGVEHFFCGGELGDMEVLDVADGPGEVAQVFFFSEGGELGDVVEADVDKALDAGTREAGKELFGGFFGEADGEKFHAGLALVPSEFSTSFIGRRFVRGM